MMTRRIIRILLSVLALLAAAAGLVLLSGSPAPIAGLSGDGRTLLRVWLMHAPGGAAKWLDAQISAYERQHSGTAVYLRQVSPAELHAAEAVQPDIVLYMPGDVQQPEVFFAPLISDAPLFSGLWACGQRQGQQLAMPLCWGAWVLALDSAYDDQPAATPAPTTLLGHSAASPEPTAAGFPRAKANAADCPLLSSGGCALYALREIFAEEEFPRWTADFAQLQADVVYQRFRARQCASAMLTTGQVTAFSDFVRAGKGFPFRVMTARTVVTDQVLLGSLSAQAQSGAAEFLAFLTSRAAQEQLARQGLFSAREDLSLYPTGWAAAIEAAARRAIDAPDAFQTAEALWQKAWQDFR